MLYIKNIVILLIIFLFSFFSFIDHLYNKRLNIIDKYFIEGSHLVLYINNSFSTISSNYINKKQTIEKLQAQLQQSELANQKLHAQIFNLEIKNKTYRSIAKAKKAYIPRYKNYVVKVYLPEGGLASQNIILKSNQAKKFHANDNVLTTQGILGNIQNISGNIVNIRLITSSNIKIPLYTKNKHYNIIATANGSNDLFINYKSKNTNLIEGEEVFTSGLNNIFIPNIKVGTLHQYKGKWYVHTFNHFDNLQPYVIVLSKYNKSR